MGRGDRRKCKCCLKLFRPDARNRRHQFYCSASGCRAASKAASQARWLAKPENEGYFRGPVNVARVQAWRARHPGYWRKGRAAGAALQDVSMAQPIGCTVETAIAARSPLQDVSDGGGTLCFGSGLHPACRSPEATDRYRRQFSRQIASTVTKALISSAPGLLKPSGGSCSRSL